LSLPDNWAELRHRLVLTSEEKRVLTFVVAALVLGMATKCYRDNRPKPPITSEKKQATRVHRPSAGRD